MTFEKLEEAYSKAMKGKDRPETICGICPTCGAYFIITKRMIYFACSHIRELWTKHE